MWFSLGNDGVNGSVPRRVCVGEAVADAEGIASCVAPLPQTAHRRPAGRQEAALTQRKAAAAPPVAVRHPQLRAQHHIKRRNLQVKRMSASIQSPAMQNQAWDVSHRHVVGDAEVGRAKLRQDGLGRGILRRAHPHVHHRRRARQPSCHGRRRGKRVRRRRRRRRCHDRPVLGRSRRSAHTQA